MFRADIDVDTNSHAFADGAARLNAEFLLFGQRYEQITLRRQLIKLLLEHVEQAVGGDRFDGTGEVRVRALQTADLNRAP